MRKVKGYKVVDGFRFTDGVSGSLRIRAMLLATGHSLASWAREEGFLPEAVRQAVSGSRENAEIRNRLARKLGKSREEIDALIAYDGVGAEDAVPAER